MTTNTETPSPVEDEVPSESYRVVVFARPDEDEALVNVLMETLGLNRLDARIHAHAAPGVLPDRLPEAQAIQLVEAIRKLGVQAAAVTDESLPKLDHPEVIHHAACRDSGFEIAGLSGAERALIAWADIELLSLGWVPLDKARHFNVETQVVVFASPHSIDERLELTSIYGAELWIVVSGADRIYRLDQDHMNYEYLGERMTDSAAVNFRVFLADLAARADHAYRTPATQAFLKHGLLDQYRFDDSAALKRATLRHILLHRVQQRGRS